MSDEEEYEYEEEEEEEEETQPEAAAAPAAEEAAGEPEPEPEAKAPEPQQEAPKEDASKAQLRKVQPQKKSVEAVQLTEAEQAMLAAKKRHEEEEAAKLLSYEEQRKIEREKYEREIRELREQQERRRAEREQDEREFLERQRQADEKRRLEDEERRQKSEARKRKQEEDRAKKAAQSGSLIAPSGQSGGRNFTVTKKERPAGEDKTVRAPRKGPTEEQVAEAKRNYLATVNRPVDVSNLLPNDLKAKIKQLHTRIVRLESEKYDLEKRRDRQEYDLKELGEREKQVARRKAEARGLDTSEVDSSQHPPKITVASKFDRQVDRRQYGDKRTIFENPYVRPAPKIAHGTARPPPEWGRKQNEELEFIRKAVGLGGVRYVENAKVEGARPPVEPKPLQLPSEDDDQPAKPQEPEPEADAKKSAPPPAARRAGRV
ncbi:CBN-TNT-2 protein [Aphelenchoides avenae]|nr:CBN-TNT-2 protein [Aphelenchus avenae]